MAREAPPGPADVVVEGDRITDIQVVAHPLVEIDQEDRPEPGDHEIDAHGMYLLPGFIDSRVHMRGPSSTSTGLGPEVKYTIRGGVVFDAVQMREEIKQMVGERRVRRPTR